MKQKAYSSIYIGRLIAALIAILMPIALMAQYADHRGRYVDSIETVLASPNLPQGEKLLKAYNDLAWGYLQTDSKKSEENARKLLALTYPAKAMNMRVNALRLLGLQAYGKNDYDKALSLFNQALAVTDSMRTDSRYTEKDIDDNLSTLYGTIANVYNMQDKALLAIEYYQKALPIFEKYNWRESMTILYHNIGELYLSMGNNEEAARNYLLAQEKGTASGDSLMMVLSLYGLAKIYIDQNNYAKAEEALNQHYAYFNNHRKEEPDAFIQTLTGYAKLHLMEGHTDLAKAEAYATQALALINEETDSETVSDVYSAVTMLAMQKHEWQKAAEYALKSIEADPNETYNDIGNYVQLAEIYTQLGQKDLATTYIHKLHNSMERFATEHYQSGLSQMEVQYQTLQKESAIERLTKEKRWLTWSVVLAGIILVLLIALFVSLGRWFALKRKHQETVARMDGETEERIRIARNLHDRMGALLTGIKLNLELFASNKSDETAKQNALALTDEAVKEMRNMAHHLMPDSLSRFGLKTAVSDFCQSIPTVSFTFIGQDRRIGKRQEEALYYIIHELVNNALKNASAQHVYVQLMIDEEQAVVNVSDDGQGLPEQTESLRFGIHGIEERVKAIDGRLSIYSKPQEGTEINIEIKA